MLDQPGMSDGVLARALFESALLLRRLDDGAAAEANLVRLLELATALSPATAELQTSAQLEYGELLVARGAAAEAVASLEAALRGLEGQLPRHAALRARAQEALQRANDLNKR
mgnify:FL=1